MTQSLIEDEPDDADPKTDAFDAVEQEKEDLVRRLLKQATVDGALRLEDGGHDVRIFSHWLRTRTVGELQQLLAAVVPAGWVVEQIKKLLR